MPITKHRPKGFTLTELLVTVVIFGVLALPLALFISKMMKVADKTTGRVLAQSNVLIAFHKIESEMRNAVLITSAPLAGNFIEFREDASRIPGHVCNPPDDDGDANAVVPPAMRWTVGNNIQDDDEDPPSSPDGNIDVQVRVYIQPILGSIPQQNEIIIARNFNGSGWIQESVLRNVPVNGLRFRYWGSVGETKFTSLDVNNDNQITAAELDVNSDSVLDAVERNGITSIDVFIAEADVNQIPVVTGPGDYHRLKFWIQERLSPILLPVRAVSQ